MIRARTGSYLFFRTFIMLIFPADFDILKKTAPEVKHDYFQ